MQQVKQPEQTYKADEPYVVDAIHTISATNATDAIDATVATYVHPTPMWR